MTSPERIVAQREAAEREALRKRREATRKRLAPEINHAISLFLAKQAEQGYPPPRPGVEHPRINWQGEDKLSWEVFTRWHDNVREIHLLSTGILVEASSTGESRYKEYSYDHDQTTGMLLGALQDLAEMPVEFVGTGDAEVDRLIRAGFAARASSGEGMYANGYDNFVVQGRKLAGWELVDSQGGGHAAKVHLLANGQIVDTWYSSANGAVSLSGARRTAIVQLLEVFAAGQRPRALRHYQFPK